MYARISTRAVDSSRPSVVLVHGLGVSSRYMIPLIRHLNAGFSVYAPDLPGFGKSEKPPFALDVPALADALAAWMDAMKLERAAFLGNSFGCQVIVEFALRYPERITKAVLQAPTVDPQHRTALQQVLRLLLDGLFGPPSLIPIVISDYLTAGLGCVMQTFRFMLQYPIEKKLPQVHIPTLVVRGGYDPTVPQRWAEQAAALLPVGQLVVIPQALHAINYSNPAALADVVRPFLDNAETD